MCHSSVMSFKELNIGKVYTCIYPYMITYECIQFAMKYILDPDLLHILQNANFHFATRWT